MPKGSLPSKNITQESSSVVALAVAIVLTVVTVVVVVVVVVVVCMICVCICDGCKWSVVVCFILEHS